jgi:hypothetical protein
MLPDRIDHGVCDATVLTPVGEGTVHGLDDVATQTKIAQAAFGIEANHPLNRNSGRGKAHALQPLPSGNREPGDSGSSTPGLSGRRSMKPVIRRHPDCNIKAVQRSASRSSAERTPCSGLGPSSIETNSSARERRPRLM